MKAAGFVNAVSFNLHEVVVLYEPHSIEDEESSNNSAPDIFEATIYLCNKFAIFLHLLKLRAMPPVGLTPFIPNNVFCIPTQCTFTFSPL